jgi:GNAT superfamily N-acetyltransferase
LSEEKLDPALITAWVKGWALSRGLPPPRSRDGGLYLDVGAPAQLGRYVFARPDPEAISALIARISAHWMFIKVCATPENLGDIWPMSWSIDTSRVVMRTTLIPKPLSPLPDGFRLGREQNANLVALSVRDRSGELAASGRLALADEIAIFDQISTTEAHRRRGLGRAIMQALTEAALDRGAGEGILVATPDGQELYANEGWRRYSPYLSAVIPNLGV